MTASEQLAKRFREALLNGTSIAFTNYKDQLEGTGWELATQQIHSLNTLSLLAQHVHYYIKGVLQVLEGGELTIRDKFSFDFPPVTSQKQWDDILTSLWEDAERFAQQVEKLTDDQLQTGFVKEAYGSYHRNIDMMIEHCYYHLGQVVIIKKMLLQ